MPGTNTINANGSSINPSVSAHKRLHWTQSIALIRHNLHGACRTGDFSFFKTLQANNFLEGSDHVANLSAILDGDADHLLQVLDGLNTGIAYVHEDAFRNVYEEIKKAAEGRVSAPITDENGNMRYGVNGDATEKRTESSDSDSLGNSMDGSTINDALPIAKYHEMVTQQRLLADAAIDKMMSSAITVIKQQPSCAQDCAAHVLVFGTTFVIDAVEVSLEQIAALEFAVDDLPRAESCLSLVQTAVSAAVSGLKGILHMLDSAEDPVEEIRRARSDSNKAKNLSPEPTNGGAWSAIRRFSMAITGSHTQPSPGTSNKSSGESVASMSPPVHAPVFTNLGLGPGALDVPKSAPPGRQSFRQGSTSSVTSIGPLQTHNIKRPMRSGSVQSDLATIPPTPIQPDLTGQMFNPFDSSFKISADGGNRTIAEEGGSFKEKLQDAGEARKIPSDNINRVVKRPALTPKNSADPNTVAFESNANAPPVPENTPSSSLERDRFEAQASEPVQTPLSSLAETSSDVSMPSPGTVSSAWTGLKERVDTEEERGRKIEVENHAAAEKGRAHTRRRSNTTVLGPGEMRPKLESVMIAQKSQF